LPEPEPSQISRRVCGVCGEAVALMSNGGPPGPSQNFPGRWYRADGTCYRLKFVHREPRHERECGRPIGVCSEEAYVAASAWVMLYLQDFIRRIDVLITDPAEALAQDPKEPPQR
jgi:hypothetical protein